MNSLKLIGFLLIIHLNGCVFEPTPKKIVGNYFLSEVNGYTDLSYNLKEDQFVGVVEPQILEVGYNENYITVKKQNIEFGKNVLNKEIEYYIIPIKNKVAKYQDDNKIGPLSKRGFNRKLTELGINDIEFTIKVRK
jgi:hypothetical protein